ncbi:hypothetical protein F8388_013529 [Cannabis sativa]|uniref:Uncharacterized protein n=1 Tax=Cannabis sativa TaxID=3483 RepID=A0A7J6G8K4_CANSA|nr:hypothetical protein F8388_013529 [Cannabis sativa]
MEHDWSNSFKVSTISSQLDEATTGPLGKELFERGQGLNLHNILVETEKCGSSFDELVTIPEQDDWLYNDGK